MLKAAFCQRVELAADLNDGDVRFLRLAQVYLDRKFRLRGESVCFVGVRKYLLTCVWRSAGAGG